MADIVAMKTPNFMPRILLVEDSKSDAILIGKVIEKVLAGECVVAHVDTLDAALKVTKDNHYDVVLLDLSLPDTHGFDGLLAVQNRAPKLPVVILTAYADEELALKAVEHGAQDYLFKDKLTGGALWRAIQYAIQRKQFEGTLIKQANFDTLTGLANRALFESRVDMALARQKRSGSGIGVFFIDLNRFKPVNDKLGHAAGDKILKQIAEILKQSIRPYDTAARFGGDEFALLVEDIAQPRDCALIARKIINQAATPFRIGNRKMKIGISIGITTCFTDEKTSRDKLMLHADKAMYGAKSSDESQYRFYTEEIHDQAAARLKLEEELRAAIAQEEFILHYQPVINLVSGETLGAEALLRWQHPTRGLLLPGEFMPVAEETGFAQELGNWVFAAVCRDMAGWQKAKLLPVPVSVNLSATQLDDPACIDMFKHMLKEHGIAATRLAVEVPSSALLEHTNARLKTLKAIHDLGIAVYLDHFGLSAISLISLKACPLDAIKIAPEIIQAINDPNGTLPLAQSILDIAHRFDIAVMATGIENEWQRAFFKEQSCNEGQGFILCRPVPSEYMPDWLNRPK